MFTNLAVLLVALFVLEARYNRQRILCLPYVQATCIKLTCGLLAGPRQITHCGPVLVRKRRFEAELLSALAYQHLPNSSSLARPVSAQTHPLPW